IKEAREALAAAAPGPWKWAEGNKKTQDLGRFEDREGWTICDFGNDAHYYPTEGKEPAEVDYHLIANAPTYLTAIIAAYEESQTSVEVLKQSNQTLMITIDLLKKSNNRMWECGDCGFAFDAQHVDVDEKGLPTGDTTCPLCAE